MSSQSPTSWRRRAVALSASAALGAAGVALLPAASAVAADLDVTGGTAAWGISSYLNASNFGRPNPLPPEYEAPATFDETTRVTTWAAGTGAIAEDGSAELAFDGTSVNFAVTSGSWLKLADLEADLDASGNGTVTAVVSYGTAPGTFPPAIPYDDSAPYREAARLPVLVLSDNTEADVVVGEGEATWSELDGSWATEFIDYIDGDPGAEPAVPGFPYAAQVGGGAPSPITFSVGAEAAAAPAVSVTTTSATKNGVELTVDGTDFDSFVPGPGAYVGLAPSGGLSAELGMEDAGNLPAFQWATSAAFTGAAFTTALSAPRAKLDPRKDYSVYVWRAHTNPVPGTVTEASVDIDWTALGFPLASKVGLKVDAKPTPKAKGAATVTVKGAHLTPFGKVEVTFKKGKKVTTWSPRLKNGKATVTLPKSGKGRWKLVAVYAANAVYAKGKATKTVKVTR